MSNKSNPRPWDLPPQILFHICRFVASPTHRALVVTQLSALNRAAYSMLRSDTELWTILLQEDYGGVQSDPSKRPRRCKRLKRGIVDQVKHAHLRIRDNTEIAYYYLSEMTQSSLKLSKLCKVLQEYGPHVRLNAAVSSGGVFLVEVCRARNVTEHVILQCVVELVERRGALVNIATHESDRAHMTALCVAAVRGMPTIVQYLLQKKACSLIRSSGRFRLHTIKRFLHQQNVTALEFANAMADAEVEAGAKRGDLNKLHRCIRLLEENESTFSG